MMMMNVMTLSQPYVWESCSAVWSACHSCKNLKSCCC